MIHKKNALIALLTDFGEKDNFTGVMKGVIAGINPDARVIDLNHGIEPQNIRQGAFCLFTAYAYFPQNSIFCVVVDPGVGSDRKGICIQTKDYLFVGPDNGVLWPAAVRNGVEKIVHLDQSAFFLSDISATFHGRDVFAPVSAHLSSGTAGIENLGPVLETCCKYEFPDIVFEQNAVTLSVLNIDRFGNITLNLTGAQFKKIVGTRPFVIRAEDARIEKCWTTYAEAEENTLFLVAASNGYMEICLKNGSAANLIRPSYDNRIILEIGDGQVDQP